MDEPKPFVKKKPAAKKAAKPAAKDAPKRRGAPTTYTTDIADAICEKLSSGMSLTRTCLELKIGITTPWQWLDRYPDFKSKYMRAREAQADFLAEEILSISDETEVEAQYQGEDIKLDLSNTAVQRNRLRVDARKWYASKVAPKKYGDKMETAITGATGGPLEVRVTYHKAVNAD